MTAENRFETVRHMAARRRQAAERAVRAAKANGPLLAETLTALLRALAPLERDGSLKRTGVSLDQPRRVLARLRSETGGKH